MLDCRRKISRAELEGAYWARAPGIFVAALFENERIPAAQEFEIQNSTLPPPFFCLVCCCSLLTDSSQDGVEAILERFGGCDPFLVGLKRLGWTELDERLLRFLAIMEPYTDDQDFWKRMRDASDAGAFEDFKTWFWAHENEIEDRIVAFARAHEEQLFDVID